jgi:hypothetical protein
MMPLDDSAKYTYNSVTKIARAWLPPSTFFHFRMYACTHTQTLITIDLKVYLCYIKDV